MASILETKLVTKKFGGFTAVDNVSLSVEPGEIRFIIGPRGQNFADGERFIFYNRWTNPESFEYINQTMRSIRKVQNDCSLLNICATDKRSLERIHTGFIFDKIVRNDDLYQYMVYLPEFKMVNRFTSRHDKVNLSEQQFKLFVFMDENRLKQKIRIELQ